MSSSIFQRIIQGVESISTDMGPHHMRAARKLLAQEVRKRETTREARLWPGPDLDTSQKTVRLTRL
jgi:hypothetical protein